MTTTEAIREHRTGDASRPESGERTTHVPYRTALPPLGAYMHALWRRRAFAVELSRCELRSQHLDTLFGRLWLVINPLMLAGVYFVLVDLLARGERDGAFLAHLVAGLFAFVFVQHALQRGITSVVSGGPLILNSAFPRALLPLAALVTAFTRFLATVPIYIVVHVAVGGPLRAEQLWAIPVLAILVVLVAGLTMAFAAAQVYFRDLHSALPYLLRTWLYLSPVLYRADEIPDRFAVILVLNPIAPLLVAWSDAVVAGRTPDPADVAAGAGWALALFLGGALFFVSREREFAVRL